MNPSELDHLGQPDLELVGLRVWIHGREFPDSADFWDGNWLRVTAYCIYPDSMVRTHGAIVHLREVVGLLRSCEQLYDTLQGRAGLDCLEPNLAVELTAETGGHINVEVAITPDHLSESHKFTDRFDQTYLPGVIAACKSILDRFPVREPENLPP
jgi:hypothetical protein